MSDELINKFDEMMENWENRLTLDNLRLVERYAEGKLEVILILAITTAAGKVRNLCAVLRHCNTGQLTRDGNGRRGPLTVEHGKGETDHGQVTMLVDVAEFVQGVEKVIPSWVWLGPVNELLRSRKLPLPFPPPGLCIWRHFRKTE